MSRTDRTTTITTTIAGESVKVTVAYAYEPAERQTMDYPGCPESVELHSVMDGNVELWSQLTEDDIQQIECDILQAMKEEARHEWYADQEDGA
jgi:hypothetical protein